MADQYVRPVGSVTDIGGLEVHVGLDFDSVSIRFAGAQALLGAAAFEEFMQLAVHAAWQAGAQSARMAAEAVPGTDPVPPPLARRQFFGRPPS